MTGYLIPAPQIMYRAPRAPKGPNFADVVRLLAGAALFVWVLLVVAR